MGKKSSQNNKYHNDKCISWNWVAQGLIGGSTDWLAKSGEQKTGCVGLHNTNLYRNHWEGTFDNMSVVGQPVYSWKLGTSC